MPWQSLNRLMSEIPGQSGYALPNHEIRFALSSSHPTRLRSADSVRQAWVCALDASGHTYRKTLFEDSAGKQIRESLTFQRLRRTPSSP